MITLVLTFCLIATGECASLTADRSYGSVEDCQREGMMMQAAVAEGLAEQGLRAAGITCRDDPDGGPKG
jgi:hypothetical protein